MRIKTITTHEIDGKMIFGEIKKHHSYGYQFYPDLDTFAARMAGTSGKNEPYWGVYQINGLIEDLQQLREAIESIRDAERVADELTKT